MRRKTNYIFNQLVACSICKQAMTNCVSKKQLPYNYCEECDRYHEFDSDGTSWFYGIEEGDDIDDYLGED